MSGEHTYHLTIASVGETKYDGRAISATFPGTDGVFGVLPHHASFITTLKEGAISVKDQSGALQSIEIQSGVLECAHNRVVVLL
jgi:F-type H+-transporting ATPase subunit epsilon